MKTGMTPRSPQLWCSQEPRILRSTRQIVGREYKTLNGRLLTKMTLGQPLHRAWTARQRSGGSGKRRKQCARKRFLSTHHLVQITVPSLPIRSQRKENKERGHLARARPTRARNLRCGTSMGVCEEEYVACILEFLSN